MHDPWWLKMARGTICVAGLMSACTAPGRGVNARVPAAAKPQPEAALDRVGATMPTPSPAARQATSRR